MDYFEEDNELTTEQREALRDKAKFAEDVEEKYASDTDVSASSPDVSTETKPQQSQPTKPQQLQPTEKKDYAETYKPSGNAIKDFFMQPVPNTFDSSKRIKDVKIGSDVEGFAKDPRTALELATAPFAGQADFLADLGSTVLRDTVEVPKLPKYQNDAAQMIRDISGFVGPQMGLKSLMGSVASKGVKLKQLEKVKFLNDPMLKYYANFGAEITSGIAVGSVYTPFETDDNIPGMLKQSFPNWWGWIPDNIATTGNDSPEMNRWKNIAFDAGFGVVTGMIGGALKFFLNRSGKLGAVIPETEKARTWFNSNSPKGSTGDLTEDIVLEVNKASDALDDLGNYNVAKDPEASLTRPTLGVHDLFDHYESSVRPEDAYGVVGAAIDQTRINLNADTVYGRVGSVYTPSTFKRTFDGAEEFYDVALGLTRKLKKADQFSYKTAGGRFLAWDDIDKASTQLAEEIFDLPMLELKSVLKQFQSLDGNTGVMQLTDVGYAATLKAIKKLANLYVDEDYLKSQALAITSISGQTSDAAMMGRLVRGDGSADEVIANNILERIEYLTTQKALTSYVRGRALNMTNVFNRFFSKDKLVKGSDADVISRAANSMKDEKNSLLKAIDTAQKRSRNFTDTMRELRTNQREYFDAFMLALEFSDGRVNTISDLINFWEQSFKTGSRFFYDGSASAGIDPIMVDAMWSNFYNSKIMSSVSALSAHISSRIFAVSPVLSAMAGSLTAPGQKKTFQRAAYGFQEWSRTWDEAVDFSKDVYRASSDPNYKGVNSAGLDTMINRNHQQMKVLEAIAEAEVAKGNYGHMAVFNQLETLQAQADHAVMRLGSRKMMGSDAFTNLLTARRNARMEAFDLLDEGKIDKDMLATVEAQAFDRMVDKDNLMIKDDFVKRISQEAAFNRDSTLANSMNTLIKTFPFLRLFAMFPRTMAGSMEFTGSMNPVGLFVKKAQTFSKPFKEMDGPTAEKILKEYGVDFQYTNPESAWNQMYLEYRGRKAGAAGLMSLAMVGTLSGFITGDGNPDYQTERVASKGRKARPKRSIYVPGVDRYFSYQWLGPYAEWLALSANATEAYLKGTLTERDAEDALSKLGWIATAFFYDQSYFKGLEPLYNMIRTPDKSFGRWAPGIVNSATIRGEGLMNQLSKIANPSLKEVENDIMGKILERTPLRGSLPEKYDELDGEVKDQYGETKESGKIEPENLLVTAINTLTPFKSYPALSKRRQFLIDVEFDGSAALSQTEGGVELTNQEISRVKKFMAEKGNLGVRIDDIMKRYDANEFRSSYLRQRKAKGKQTRQNHLSLHTELNNAYRVSVNEAIANIDLDGAIAQREFEKNLNKEQNRRGIVTNKATEFIKEVKPKVSY